MEKQIKKIYKKASRDLYRQFKQYLEEANAHVERLETHIKALKAIGQDTQREEELLRLRKKEVTLQSVRYEEMVEGLTRNLANVNQTAVEYVTGELPEIYTWNFNQKPYAGVDQIRFDIVDENVIKRRILDGDIKLPKKKIYIPKDMRWNTRQLNSSVLQGILNGESMTDIAKRILPITNRNEVSALRNARTMVTGAENQGRVDRFDDLESKGVILNKVWIATSDGRVREWHASMDGQEVGIHDSFVDGNGNELEYPGDPSAPGETVYNCRCSMKSHIIGFRKEDGRIEYV